MAVTPATRAPIYEGTRIPHPIPTVLRVSQELRDTGDVMTVNFGPNHPSTHGVLRLIVDLFGEDVVGLEAVVGYLHTGFEKNMEQKTWWKAITYPERIDYLSFQNNELVFVLAIEKLLELETPPKASWMRTCLCELNRIHSHLVWLGTAALELGAISMFWYCFREREQILDLFELVTGARMHTRYFQAGGLAEDIPRGFYPEARKFVDGCRTRSTTTRRSSTATRSGSSARRGSACSRPTTRSRSASRGRCCARRASTGTSARSSRTSPTTRSTSACPVYHEGDVYARYRVHMEEMRESTQDRRAVPRPARGDGGRALDRGRPQGRAAAARGAPHLDGVADPPLQDRHRGLPRPRGRGLRRRSSRRAASSAATSSPTAARSRGGSSSARRRSSRSRRRRRA